MGLDRPDQARDSWRGSAVNWLPVVGWEGLYEVSDSGQVRSLGKVVVTKRGVVKNYAGRVLRQYPNHKGHLKVWLIREGYRSHPYVHSLVLEAFVGPRPTGQQGLHSDDVPSNNHLENLRWGTPSENNYDTVKNGNHKHANKTHCPRGHKYSLENTYMPPSKINRRCRACTRKYG